MKSKLTIIVLIALAVNLIAQDKNNYILKIGETELGGYLGLNTRLTSVNSQTAGFLDLKAAVTINGSWAIGIDASGLHYDKKLNVLANDGTYHLEAGYIGLFVEKIFTLDDDLKFSLSILMANGLAKYRYDKDYRKDKLWYEETIDETTFYVFEPGMEIQYRIAGNWWIGLTGSLRSTSPVEMIGTDEGIFRKASGGLTFKYGIF